jgi:hypothetical protein
MIQRALAEPANLGYIKNVLGLTELVIPGEESRNKQLREIQQLLASAPIVISMHPSGVAHVEPAPSDVVAQHAAPLPGDSVQSAPSPAGSTSADAREVVQRDALRGSGQAAGTTSLVLPSVPVDQLLDDHAVEFEECKRWANSDAGQAARMTNPAGFANVRAHAEAHLRAMAAASALNSNPASLIQSPQPARMTRVSPPPPAAELHTSSTAVTARIPREFVPHGDAERDAPGDHWVTIDGHHVLIHEPQGKQTQETPQSLAAQIPCHVKNAIAASIKASNSPTADDKKGGFHEEGGQWIVTADGKIVPVPAKPGPANPKIEGGAHVVPSDAVNPSLKDNAVDLGGTWHVHPSGTLTEEKGNARNTKNFNQPPSAKDIKEAGSGMNIVVGARDKMMYFYNNSGLIAKPMKLKDFLKGC